MKANVCMIYFFIFLQQATLLDRMHIIPSAETAEAPRERKEDSKPGTSNVKVIKIKKQFVIFIDIISKLNHNFIADFLYDLIWNDLCYCIGCIGYNVVSKA